MARGREENADVADERDRKIKTEKDKEYVGRSGTRRRLEYSLAGGRGKMVPRWVKYSGPVPSKGAGLSPP